MIQGNLLHSGGFQELLQERFCRANALNNTQLENHSKPEIRNSPPSERKRFHKADRKYRKRIRPAKFLELIKPRNREAGTPPEGRSRRPDFGGNELSRLLLTCKIYRLELLRPGGSEVHQTYISEARRGNRP